MIELVAAEQPAKAAALQEYTASAQIGLLGHLAGTHSQGHHSDAVEMWRATKDTRELTCITRHLPSGAVDVCVYKGVDFHKTQLCQSAPDARTLAATWLAALEASGWTVR